MDPNKANLVFDSFVFALSIAQLGFGSIRSTQICSGQSITSTWAPDAWTTAGATAIA